MEKLKYNKKSVDIVIGAITAGGVVIFPTETVYGIGCSIKSKKGINRIYKLKKRPKSKPLQVLISNMDQAKKLARNIPQKALELMRNNWPGPLTIVLNKKGKGTIGLRIPDYKPLLKIIETCGPISATSANISGHPAPITADEIVLEADLLLDGGKCKLKTASKVVDFTSKLPKILRHA